jgi:hypothetical protein
VLSHERDFALEQSYFDEAPDGVEDSMRSHAAVFGWAPETTKILRSVVALADFARLEITVELFHPAHECRKCNQASGDDHFGLALRSEQRVAKHFDR